MNSFTSLITELSEQIGTPLHVEHDSICSFLVDGKIRIQIEEDPTAQRLLIVAVICEIPAGKFRENILRQMLILNGGPLRKGIFSYISQTTMLTFHRHLYPNEISALKLADALGETIDVAQTCSSAIQNGQAPLL